MSKYIQIPDNIITLVKFTNIKSFEDGLTKINIIHHFMTNEINNQIKILKFMVNTINLNSSTEFNPLLNSNISEEEIEELKNIPDMDLNLNLSNLKTESEEINKCEELPETTINTYETFIEARNFYLSELEFQHFNKLQRCMIPLLKQIETYYYINYYEEIENIDELLSDIENKLKYINEFQEDIESQSNFELGNNINKYESTYNILTYLYDLYSSIRTTE